MDKQKNLYQILEIEENAKEEDIKIAYKRLAKKYHPDLNKNDPHAKDKFIELKNAYDTLIDPEKRKIYDQLGYNPKNIDFSDLFNIYDLVKIKEIFKAMFSSESRRNFYKSPPETLYI